MDDSPLIECVPNFSEGRRREVIDGIVAAIASVSGIRLLHQTSDVDHNRTVVTFAGPPGDVLEAAFRGTAKAAETIDMEAQRGVHPRIGAADVVPLVPLRGITLAECAELASQLGQRVGEELALPVYLYAAAARLPGRQRLSDIRRGQYEGLKTRITADPDWSPDYGPRRMGPAGAVAIGARLALIAFNVYLNTDDVETARRIARSIRASSGGLAGVQAMGVLAGGRAQVSMNLTDYARTPIPRVMELIRAECRRYGVAAVRSELIGLIPQQAVLDAAAWYLQLDDFDAERVLEYRLLSAPPPGAEKGDSPAP